MIAWVHTLGVAALTLTLAAQGAPAPVAEVSLEDIFTIPDLISGVADSISSVIDGGSKVPSIFKENPELFKLHADLVKIESISGNEYGVSRYLRKYLSDLNLGFELNVDESRRNIYAFSGTENSSVLLTSHIDTVPPYIHYSIAQDENGGTRIYGRGSCDAKGSVAAQIIAAKELVEDGLVKPEELGMLYVFQEEVGGAGMLLANDYFNNNSITWDAVIFGEPTENKLATGHKGIYLADIEVKGKASHSGYPEVGIDANKILIEIMHEIESYPWPTSEILNTTTVNIGLFQGGTAGNVVSPHASCKVLMRTPVDSDLIAPVVAQIVEKHLPEALEIQFNVEVTDDPTFLDYQVPGFDTYIASYATDIPKLDHKNFTRYLYGPGTILVAHGDDEYVTAESLLQAVDDYKKLVLFSLGR